MSGLVRCFIPANAPKFKEHTTEKAQFSVVFFLAIVVAEEQKTEA